MEEKLIQLDFLAAFDRVSHFSLLYKPRSIDVEGLYLSLLSEIIRDRRQRVRLNEVSGPVDVVSEVPQGSVLGRMLFISYASDLFHIVGNHIVGRAKDTTIYAVVPRPLSRPQVLESLNQDLAASNS